MDLTTVVSFAFLDMLLVLIDSCHGLPTHWCPTGRYPTHNGKCKLCYDFCGRDGCTGPERQLREGGCSSCWLGLEVDHSRIQCLSPFSNCPVGHYRKMITREGHTFPVCRQCHSLCQTCSGPGVAFCDTCKYSEVDGVCVRACPLGFVWRGRRRNCVLFGGYSRPRPFHLLPYRDRYRHTA